MTARTIDFPSTRASGNRVRDFHRRTPQIKTKFIFPAIPVKCRALPSSGLRLKANRVRGFRESGDKVRGERNPKLKSRSGVQGVRVHKLKSTYFWGSSPPIYTSSKLPSCNNDYKSKPSKNPLEYSFLSTESSSVFHNFPPNSINILPELSGIFHPLPYYILPSVPLHHNSGYL